MIIHSFHQLVVAIISYPLFLFLSFFGPFLLSFLTFSQVRVHNLQELVYKQGQSRVSRASVTLTFDNRSPGGPVGFEACSDITVTRIVVIGGRNKYLINGHTAQLARVQNLFHSVQLNVNNPHFLIMQGRITKVVTMKPPELLAMIEEAAGTRMFENKKQAALKTIEKKQMKVEEIKRILDQDITPTLDKLRIDRQMFTEYSAKKTECEKLNRFVIAYTYKNALETEESNQQEINKIKESITDLNTAMAAITYSVTEKEKAINTLLTNKEDDANSTYNTLQTAVAEQSRALVKSTSTYENKVNQLKEEEENYKTIDKELKKAEVNFNKKVEETKELKQVEIETRKEYEKWNEKVDELRSAQLGFDTGKKGEEEKVGGGGIAGQLMNCQQQKAELESEINKCEMKRKHLETEIKKKTSAFTAYEKEHKQQTQDLKKKQSELDKLQSQLTTLDAPSSSSSSSSTKSLSLSSLETLVSRLRDELSSSHDALSLLTAKLSRIDFPYVSPTKDFDRSKVKGLVARLIKIKDNTMCRAIEITAGGKLYQVVVDTTETGKQLLDSKLQKRVTILPLNKISTSNRISSATISKAEEILGKENVSTALSLVGYEKELDAAMIHVFGSTFICADGITASKCAFDKSIATKAVTIDGDIHDPSGSMEGGAAPSNESILTQFYKMNELKKKCKETEEKLQAAQEQLKSKNENEKQKQKITDQIDMLATEIHLATSRLASTEYAQIDAEVSTLRIQLTECKSADEVARSSLAAGVIKISELERSVNNFATERATQMKVIEKEITNATKSKNNADKELKKKSQTLEKSIFEEKALQSEMKLLQDKLTASNKIITTMKEEIKKLESGLSEEKQSYDSAYQNLVKEKEKLEKNDKMIGKLKKELAQLKKEHHDNEMEVKKLQNKLARVNSDIVKAKKDVENLDHKFEWIANDKHLFGRPHTDYDFNAMDYKSASIRLATLLQEQENISSKINKKVLGMFEKAEQEYSELMKKKHIIEADKAKIEQVILELERKKNEALQTTWKRVTIDFGSIMSSLLPGVTAKLDPPEGGTVLDGLEMKVAFGGVWKDSLSELSGGQRSLLALSLILALLLFKPAPMYILDEIDAALDLSHTQNIGTMLKTHFPQSQFIVVSLKEGMFNNANVIFRTKFDNGVSGVTVTNNKRK